MTDDATTKTTVPGWERTLPRVSSVAAIFTTLCCIGLSAAVSLVTALGASFMTRDSTLEPLLGIMLMITVVASALTSRRHGSLLPLTLTIASGALIYGALYGDFGNTGSGGHEPGAAAAHSTTEQHAAPTTSAPTTSAAAQPTTTDSHGDSHGTSDPHGAHPTTDAHGAHPTDAHGAHPTTDAHGAHPTTDAHAPHPTTDAHSAPHGTTDAHANDPHATDDHAADDHATDDHAAGASGGHGDGHGGTTGKVLVYLGILVLIGAQVWDFLRLRAIRAANLGA